MASASWTSVALVFRVTDNNTFRGSAGAAMDVQGALGSWTVQDNTFLGPIGTDGISIVDFSGSGFQWLEMPLVNSMAQGSLPAKRWASWTVQDNTFLGPIGTDGIAIEGFQGGAVTIAGNSLSGVVGVGIA